MKTAGQKAYEAAPGSLHKILPWDDLPQFWKDYWAMRAAPSCDNPTQESK